MNSDDRATADETGTPKAREGTPVFRPTDRFWPYVELPQHPTAEELAQLEPDLHDALFGRRERPFSITIVFPKFEGGAFERAMELARGAAELREVGQGAGFRVRARFDPSQALALRNLFELVGGQPDTDVLVDDRPVPYARELWLPLVWFLIPR